MNFLYEYIEHIAERYPEKIALKEDSSSYCYTFAQLKSQIHKIAAFFQFLGIQKQDKICLFAENHPRWMALDSAIMKCGAISVPRGSSVPLSELQYIFNHSDASFLITDSIKLIENFLPLLKEKQIKNILYIGDTDISGVIDNSINIHFYDEAINQTDAREFNSVEIDLDDISTLVYTSGTSGMPKAAMLSHKNIASQIINCQKRIGFIEGKTFVSVLPLWHIGPRTYDYYFLSIGGTIVYSKYKNYIDSLKKYKPDYINCVPKVINLIYEELLNKVEKLSFFKKYIFKVAYNYSMSIKRNDSTFSSATSVLHNFFYENIYAHLKKDIFKDEVILISGAASLSKDVEDFFNVFEIPILVGYGLSETSPLLTHSALNSRCLYSVGKAFDDTEIKIVDPNNYTQLEDNKPGLILARGSQVMRGYYKNDEENHKTILQNGFLVTGDRGFLTEDNFLFISGRYKDVIVLANGETIEPVELEQACLNAPYVSQILFAGQDALFLTGLIYLDQVESKKWAEKNNINPENLHSNKTFKQMIISNLNQILSKRQNFRYFEKLKDIYFIKEPFSVQNDLMTHTSKIKRLKIYETYKDQVAEMYK